jgi:hypothetical protein
MDPLAIATAVTSLVAPYLARAGGAMLEGVGEKLPEQIGKLWEVISNRFMGNPAASGAAHDLAQNAEDTDNREVFILQLKKVLRDDEKFAGLLQTMLKESQGEQINNVGDGAVATHGSIAVGKIQIEGGASGNIVIGNNSQTPGTVNRE